MYTQYQILCIGIFLSPHIEGLSGLNPKLYACAYGVSDYESQMGPCSVMKGSIAMSRFHAEFTCEGYTWFDQCVAQYFYTLAICMNAI